MGLWTRKKKEEEKHLLALTRVKITNSKRKSRTSYFIQSSLRILSAITEQVKSTDGAKETDWRKNPSVLNWAGEKKICEHELLKTWKKRKEYTDEEKRGTLSFFTGCLFLYLIAPNQKEWYYWKKGSGKNFVKPFPQR